MFVPDIVRDFHKFGKECFSDLKSDKMIDFEHKMENNKKMILHQSEKFIIVLEQHSRYIQELNFYGKRHCVMSLAKGRFYKISDVKHYKEARIFSLNADGTHTLFSTSNDAVTLSLYTDELIT